MQKQVEKSHYQFQRYVSKHRWVSFWHQLDEVVSQRPDSVLEIGPGPGVFNSVAKAIGLHVITLDIDHELKPDCVGVANALPFSTASIDVVCAFEVLEHMPFDMSMQAFAECMRVARKRVVISLPDVMTAWASTVTIPKLGKFRFVLPRPLYRPPKHQFNGEHYWEISKQGYPLELILSSMSEIAGNSTIRTYRVHEYLFHRFFIIQKDTLHKPVPKNSQRPRS